MLYKDDTVIKEYPRKSARFAGEMDRITYYRCECRDCGAAKGYCTKSRYNKKPLCIKCSTNMKSHRETLSANHWATKGIDPWNKTSLARKGRNAVLKDATPKWLTPEQKIQIRDFYRNCPPGHDVDHVIPLKGKTFCGLHVPWNLQWLPSDENKSKGNQLLDANGSII